MSDLVGKPRRPVFSKRGSFDTHMLQNVIMLEDHVNRRENNSDNKHVKNVNVIVYAAIIYNNCPYVSWCEQILFTSCYSHLLTAKSICHFFSELGRV